MTNKLIVRLARPTIGRKFTLLFAVILLVVLASGVTIDRSLGLLEGAAAQINLAGSLRWMARDAPTIRRALSAESLSVRRGYLDAARVAPTLERLSADLEGSDCLNSWDLVDVFGLEVWLRVFFSSAPRRDDGG